MSAIVSVPQFTQPEVFLGQGWLANVKVPRISGDEERNEKVRRALAQAENQLNACFLTVPAVADELVAVWLREQMEH